MTRLSKALYTMINTLVLLWVLLVEVCVVVLADICFACLFLKTTQLREGPGQLIFVQAQAQIIVDLHWLILFFGEPSETACTVFSFMASLGFTISCTYTAAICVAVRMHSDKPKYPKVWGYHIAVLIISLTLSLIIFLLGNEQNHYFSFCVTHQYIFRTWTK